jgi:hypothetical protein
MALVLMAAGALMLRNLKAIVEWLPRQWENISSWWGYPRPPTGSRRERFDRVFATVFLAFFAVAWVLLGLWIIIGH